MAGSSKVGTPAGDDVLTRVMLHELRKDLTTQHRATERLTEAVVDLTLAVTRLTAAIAPGPALVGGGRRKVPR